MSLQLAPASSEFGIHNGVLEMSAYPLLRSFSLIAKPWMWGRFFLAALTGRHRETQSENYYSYLIHVASLFRCPAGMDQKRIDDTQQ